MLRNTACYLSSLLHSPILGSTSASALRHSTGQLCRLPPNRRFHPISIFSATFCATSFVHPFLVTMSTTSISDIVRRLKEEDGSPPSLAEQQALQNFLDQKTTAEAAVRDYTQTVTDSKSPNPEDIWDLLRRVAQGLPQTHESLTHLLKAIKQLPPVTRDGKVLEDNGEQYWSDLPGFSFGTREYWDGEDSRIPLSKVVKIESLW